MAVNCYNAPSMRYKCVFVIVIVKDAWQLNEYDVFDSEILTK